MKTNKKVTISMKKYIKPEIEIMHAAPAHLMGISTMKLSTNTSVLHNSNTQQDDNNFNIIGGDEVVEGDGDLDASKRWNDWGDQLWTGYSPW
jgi:hypothetical protein